MPTGWQREYGASRDFRTPQERARERTEHLERLQAEAERRKNAEAYLCPECGYWSPGALIRANNNLHCPACGASIIAKHLYAPCPRCEVEQNVSYITYNHAQPEWLSARAAKTICIECQIQGKRLPERYKGKSATVPVREEIING